MHMLRLSEIRPEGLGPGNQGGCFGFGDRVSPCDLGWPQTRCIVLASLFVIPCLNSFSSGVIDAHGNLSWALDLY